MKIHLISIFPEIFQSFLDTSLIKKAQDKNILEFKTINPRDFCIDKKTWAVDKHRQVDDTLYGWWAGMLMMAQPMIDSVNSIIEKVIKKDKSESFKIIFPTPSQQIRNQESAHSFSKTDNLIFICGRYEWIDHRFVEYFTDKYPDNFFEISLWKFITLWWELPTMTMIESIVRLIPWVIKEELSWQDESYTPSQNMENIEYPQYTRPQQVEWYKVPPVLLNWNHKEIQKRRDKNSQ